MLLDVYSRYAYAEYKEYLSMENSFKVALKAQKVFPHKIKVIQTDNGGEFGEGFYFLLKKRGIKLRHTRVRKPNDNAHVERFIRTLKEECFKSKLPKKEGLQRKLNKYIHFYNTKRYHLGINCNTPCSFVAKLMN